MISCFSTSYIGSVAKVSAGGSEGRWFDTRLHQLSD